MHELESIPSATLDAWSRHALGLPLAAQAVVALAGPIITWLANGWGFCQIFARATDGRNRR